MRDAEAPDVRLKRLRMRSMRRGIREMDLILTDFADAELARMSPDELDNYDRLLNENDQDLYVWVTGKSPAPERFKNIVARIASALQRN